MARITFAILLIASAPSAALAQGLATIHGTVLLSDKTPAEGATVIVTDRELGLRRVATTNRQGRFVFLGLPSSRPYTIRAEKEGLTAVASPIVHIYAGEILEVDTILWRTTTTTVAPNWWGQRKLTPGVFVLPLQRYPIDVGYTL